MSAWVRRMILNWYCRVDEIAVFTHVILKNTKFPSITGKEKCRKKVLVGKGTHAYQQSNLGHSHCTAHVCVAADGRVLPTCIIFEGGLPHRNFTDGIPPSWLARFSSCGSIIFFCRTAEVGDQFFSSSTTTIPISHCPFLKRQWLTTSMSWVCCHTQPIFCNPPTFPFLALWNKR